MNGLAATQVAIRHRIDADRIGQVALELLEAEGRSALSMRALARVLNCEAMSIYHHVDGIDGVLDSIVNRLFVMMMDGRELPRSPQQRLKAYAYAYLDLADAYPEAFPLLATRLLHMPAALDVMHSLISTLRDMGLSPSEALRQTRILGAFLNGAGLALAAWSKTEKRALRSMQAVAVDERLNSLEPRINQTSVREDLDAGLTQILESIFARRPSGCTSAGAPARADSQVGR